MLWIIPIRSAPRIVPFTLPKPPRMIAAKALSISVRPMSGVIMFTGPVREPRHLVDVDAHGGSRLVILGHRAELAAEARILNEPPQAEQDRSTCDDADEALHADAHGHEID